MVATEIPILHLWKELFQKSSLPDVQKEESWRKFSFRNFHPNHYTYSNQYKFISNYGEELKICQWKDLNQDYQSFILNYLSEKFTNYELDYFTLQSLISMEDGIFIQVPSNFQTQQPCEFKLQIPNSSNLFAPFIWIEIKDNTNISFLFEIESNYSSLDAFQWINPLVVLYIHPNCNVRMTFWENLGSSVFYFKKLFSQLNSNSQIKLFQVYFGGYKAKSRQKIVLNGKGTELNCYGISALKDKEFWDHETEILHHDHYQSSSLVHKVIGKDKSHHIFTGNLIISPGLKRVQSSQVNHNLLLDKKARLESIPKLEIFSEDVQSSHGSTVGEISDEQLFYLLARGVPKEEAIHLLTEGFVAEILNLIEVEEWKNKISLKVQEVLWPSK